MDPGSQSADDLKHGLEQCRGDGFLFRSGLCDGATGKVLLGAVESVRMRRLREMEIVGTISAVTLPSLSSLEASNDFTLAEPEVLSHFM